MPPYSSVQQTSSTSSINKESIISSTEIQTKRDQLERFRQHCELFYQYSLNTSNSNDNGKLNYNIDVNASREVLNVFNSLHSGQKGHVESNFYESELKKCGLGCNMSSEELLELSKISNEERKKAHEQGMQERYKLFDKILNYTNRSGEDDAANESMNNCENCIKKFVLQYKRHIGVHPILAGMRYLLETQIENDKKMILWKFNSAAITESSFGADSNNVTKNEFLHNTASVLQSFLFRVVEEEKEDNFNDSDGKRKELLLCWKVKSSLNRRKMKRLLCFIPQRRDLHARPTGELFVTDMVRVSDKDWWCFWLCL